MTKTYAYAKVTQLEEETFNKFPDKKRQYQYARKVLLKGKKATDKELAGMLKEKFGDCLLSLYILDKLINSIPIKKPLDGYNKLRERINNEDQP